jgi:hypothetical protein
MTTIHEFQARLHEAEAAYHKLQTGTLAVQVRTSDGKFVTYAEADRAELAGYISSIRSSIAAIQGVTSSRRSPIYIRF